MAITTVAGVGPWKDRGNPKLRDSGGNWRFQFFLGEDAYEWSKWKGDTELKGVSETEKIQIMMVPIDAREGSHTVPMEEVLYTESNMGGLLIHNNQDSNLNDAKSLLNTGEPQTD